VNFLSLKNYLSSLFGFAKRPLIIALFLMLLVGITEGIGVMMLVPLLGFVGITDVVQVGAAEADGPVTEALRWVVENTGLTFSLTTLLIIFTLFICTQAVLRRRADLLIERITLGFVDFLRQRLFWAISSTNWLFFVRKRTSDFNHVLTSDISRVYQGTYFVLRLSILLVMAIAYIAASFYLSAEITAMTLIVGIVLLAFLRPSHKKSRRLGEAYSTQTRDLYDLISEQLQGMKLAKIFGRENKQTFTFNVQTDLIREHQLEFQRSHSSSQMWFKISAVFSLSILVFIANKVVMVPPAELLVLIFIFARLMPLAIQGQQCYQQVIHMLPAFDVSAEMYNTCLSAQEESSANTNRGKDGVNKSDSPALSEKIELSHVYFEYEKQRPVLKNIDLTIPAHSTTALIGPSGSGKSTLADLLMGLVSADEGALYVDGTLITKKLQHSWRQKIAYVPQETFLFHQSIRDNLLWADPSASEARLWVALKQAAADKFVKALPDGLDTLVGERGISLSGGERQRIAIARALMKNPTLLILDEATSSLDTENEKQIQNAIDRLHGELTIVIIAHRLSTVRHADQIAILDAGKIIEHGSWGELANKKDGYLSLMAQSAEKYNRRRTDIASVPSGRHGGSNNRT
jgi:ATP-binding cassette subfamily C protein